MKVRLLLITDAVGGVWVYSLELARALEAEDVDMVLAVLGPSPSPMQRDEARGFKLIDTGLPLDWLATGPDELKRAGRGIAELAARERADIVQTCSAAHIADARFDQPCVAVQHSCVASWWAAVEGTPLPPDFAWRREQVERGLSHAAAVVAPTVAFAAQTARIYAVDAPIQAVHNGMRPRAADPVAQSDFVFTASRLWDAGKNAATLDAAAARLKAPFAAAGARQGPNGVSVSFEHLRTLGELSPARLSAMLAAKPIFASAALYEPFGLSVLEAAQAGCALVLSDIPTHRELWGGAAMFVPARSPEDFASAIQTLLDDRKEREKRGQLARACAELYTPERMARSMAAIYSDLAQPKAEPALRLVGAA